MCFRTDTFSDVNVILTMIYATIIYEKKAEWSPTVKEIHDNIVQDLYTQEQKKM